MMPLCVKIASRVDLRHDERHVGIHAKRRRVVDDDRAGLDGGRRELLRRAAAGREQADVDAREAGFSVSSCTGQILAAELHRLAGRARGREQLELLQRKLALLEAVKQLDADGARGTDDRDDGI